MSTGRYTGTRSQGHSFTFVQGHSFFINDAPNFEEVEEAYWFEPVCPDVCPSITLGYDQEPLEIGS